MDTQWREIIADWKGGNSFNAHNAVGGSIQIGTIDETPGLSAMQLLLAGLAGCSGADVASILYKKKQPLKDFQILVRGKMADDYPKVYTEIHVTYLLWGDGLDPQAVERAIQLSEEKYCSVGHQLRASTPIYSTYRILSPGEKVDEFEEIIK